jgi:AraC-like DNA-binding protein
MKIDLTNILFVLIIFQLLLVSLILLTQVKGKRVSNILLGLFFLTICLNLLDVFLLQIGVYFSNPQLAGWGSCLPLLFGPFIYFYTKSVIYKDFRVTFKSWLHFLPFIVLCTGTEYSYLIQSWSEQERILSGLQQHHLPKVVSIISSLIFIQFLLYVLASLKLVSRYKKASGQYFSDRKNMDVSWLYTTLLFFIAIIIISALNGLFAQTTLVKYYLLVFNFVILVMLFYIIRVLFKVLRKPYFFSFYEEEDVHVQRPYPKTNLSDPQNNETDKIAQIVIQYMQSNKPYLDPELTLDQLSSLLSLRPRVLSQVINKMLGENFYDFINRYRIEEASRMLTNPKDKKITILEVLYDVGFNSKSSFNTLFKKYTGLTPSEFKKKNQL